jgi:serine/threonine-protein kinase
VDPKTHADPAAEQLRAQLRRILASPLFATARRLSQFLEFVVSRSIEGQASDIKESLIGVEVYGREATYDPKADSIVRAEASRLRAKLREYYETEGRQDPIRIELPKGSYSPVFLAAGAVETVPQSPPAAPTAPSRPRRMWVPIGALVVLLVLAAVWWQTHGLHRARSIAVMPLVNLAPDRSSDPLGDTLTEELTGALLASGDWRVAGRAPVLDLSGRDQMLTPLRQNLGADVVLTGSYRITGNADVRLTLEIVNIADGYLLWSQTYHRRVTELGESQKELARIAVAEFTHKLMGRGVPELTKTYAQARQAWSTYTPQGLEQSLKLFQQAIQADPKFAPAWAGFADASSRLADTAHEPGGQEEAKRLADARRAAARAIALDETNAEAHGVLGWIYLFREWNFQGAAQELQRAVALDPARVSVNLYCSQALTILGEMGAAEQVILAARTRFPPAAELLLQEGSVYFLSRKFEKMESIGRELIAMSPASPSGHWLAGVALEQRGHVAEAIGEFKTGLRKGTSNDLRTLCALSHAYVLTGDQASAMQSMQSYYRPGAQDISRFDLPYCVALTFTGMKQKDTALDWLEKARASRDPSFPFFPYDARFDPLKEDARYARLVESLKHGGELQ